MAMIKVEMYSNSLVRPVAFEVFIPNDPRMGMPTEPNPHYDRPCKTVFVLHGYTGWGKGWDVLYEYATQYNLALVFPSVENSFYLDADATGFKHGTFVGVELVEYLRKTFGLCLTKEDTYISGLSMGGFGALRTGLAYSDSFSKIIALSSALIVHQIANMKPGEDNPVANYDYYRHCFGDLEKLVQSDNNPETLVKKLIQQNKDIPEIYMACGTEDFLLEPNRQFKTFLLEQKVNVVYKETGGNHDMTFWNEYFGKGFAWLVGEGV